MKTASLQYSERIFGNNLFGRFSCVSLTIPDESRLDIMRISSTPHFKTFLHYYMFQRTFVSGNNLVGI